MNTKEVWDVALAVIASLGGGGLIVFGLSGYLGRLWADRALEKERHEYAKLNIAFTQQLDLATRRIQVELDALGHLQKLAIETEFEKIQELWKNVASMRTSFFNLPKAGFRLVFADPTKQHELELKSSQTFSQSLDALFEVWTGEMLSIPKEIADKTGQLVDIACVEQRYVVQYPDPFEAGTMAAFDGKSRAAFFDQRAERLKQFVDGADELEAMMRRHLRGEVKAQDSVES